MAEAIRTLRHAYGYITNQNNIDVSTASEKNQTGLNVMKTKQKP